MQVGIGHGHENGSLAGVRTFALVLDTVRDPVDHYESDARFQVKPAP